MIHLPQLQNFLSSSQVPENYKPDSVVVKIVDGEEVKYSRYNGAFVCRFCPKAFYRLFSLQRHERTHTGHKPCSCPVCCRKFSEPRNLRAHMLRFHEGWLILFILYSAYIFFISILSSKLLRGNKILFP